jgi:hypothetical protein
MKAPSKKFQTLIAAGFLMGMCSLTFGQTTIFGSDNDGLGGFTQSSTLTDESWTTNADAVRYQNANASTYNSSFLTEFVMDRSVGKSYTITGTLNWVDGDPDTNNRFGMYFFGDNNTVPNENELGALGLIYNADDGDVAPADSNDDDDLGWLVGIDQSPVDSVLRTQTLVPSAGDLIGSEFTFTTQIDFVDVSGDTYINLSATMNAGGEDTLLSTQVLASDYTGDYFGFVTRARDNSGAGLPWTVDYTTFNAIPEPSTLALLGVALGFIAMFRRRK